MDFFKRNLLVIIFILGILLNIYIAYQFLSKSEQVSLLSQNLKSLPDCVPVYNNDINIEINSAPSQTMIVNQVYPCIEGPRGERGKEGDEGSSGDKGDKGDKGDQGDIGPQGLKGDTGEKGDKGDTGEKGEDGERGPTGPIGPSGPSGTTNLTYGSFFDTTTQTNATPNIARGVKYNSTAESDGISINDGSIIKISKTGVYNFQFSIQIYKSDGGSDTIDFWLVKNNSNVPDTNTRLTMFDRYFYSVAAWNYVVSANAGDEFQLYWSSPDTNASLLTLGPFTSPTRPRIPSVIMTVTQIR